MIICLTIRKWMNNVNQVHKDKLWKLNYMDQNNQIIWVTVRIFSFYFCTSITFCTHIAMHSVLLLHIVEMRL